MTPTMTLPSFLIIGAMKSGTTTLFHDLRQNPSIFIPEDKELEDLITDSVLSPAGIEKYAKFFARAKANQCCGEASTAYTKLPDIGGVPNRAHETLGANIRLIYLVRNPVSRLISHYHHLHSAGDIDLPIDEAIQDCPELLSYSKYAMQLDPWIKQFGRDNIKVIIFESYVKDRRNTLLSIYDFLGVERSLEKIQEDSIYNKGDGKPINNALFTKISHSRVYRSCIRPLLSLSARAAIKKMVLPKAKTKTKPSKEKLEWVVAQLQSDMDQFRLLLEDKELPWDISSAPTQFSREE
jgi:hypothetical protein